MAFVKIEDKYGEIELVVFPKVLADISYMLSVDMPIAATGEISAADDETPKILVKSVVLLSESFEATAEPSEKKPQKAAPAPTKMYLRVDSIPGEKYERSAALVSIFPGDVPVIFYDAKSKEYKKDSVAYMRPAPTAMQLLRDILGDENVVMK